MASYDELWRIMTNRDELCRVMMNYDELPPIMLSAGDGAPPRDHDYEYNNS